MTCPKNKLAKPIQVNPQPAFLSPRKPQVAAAGHQRVGGGARIVGWKIRRDRIARVWHFPVTRVWQLISFITSTSVLRVGREDCYRLERPTSQLLCCVPTAGPSSDAKPWQSYTTNTKKPKRNLKIWRLFVGLARLWVIVPYLRKVLSSPQFTTLRTRDWHAPHPQSCKFIPRKVTFRCHVQHITVVSSMIKWDLARSWRNSIKLNLY